MKKILFVCIENSNRSQMSQAFAKILGGKNVAAYSAGSRPSGIVNPAQYGKLPAWHEGAGGDTHIFTDEIDIK